MTHRIPALAALLLAVTFAGAGMAADNAAQENRKAPKRASATGQVPARGVQQLCSGRSYFSREFCETKACFKAEYQYDPICVKRREPAPPQQM